MILTAIQLRVLQAVVVVLLLACVAFGGLAARQTFALKGERLAHEKTRTALAQVREEHAAAVTDAVIAALDAERAARAEESRRAAAVQEVIDADIPHAQQRRASAAGLRAVLGRLGDAGRLRDAAAAPGADRADRGDAAGDAAAAGAGAASAGPGLVPPELHRRGDGLPAIDLLERHADLAIAFDDAFARGRLCERAYDALTPPGAPTPAPDPPPAAADAP